ncbi:PEP-utilizing enzyme [Allokutzneria sp. A3M-2-11 16]|uniref:PEP/pyruvate-binding domain-containing protein n=1 Tax=Allokutzneria sp. A3M-2-11 16 TaxID=2962043 RepID=UPI0020B7DF0F|nr:PEP/pyruvate-binding domain-containing protein [Allokutzneria sp. A3M-2-11 16]MCP3799297.1 PEP-utilizing enzyme [Allokutzneria sp. A3M-2-11 16]
MGKQRGKNRRDVVLDLAALDGGMGELVGGKAANLGELINAGIPVPPGFCVTTDAYRRMVEVTGPVFAQEPATAREMLCGATIPADLAEEISTAYRALGDDVPVAVRSSATAEDLPNASFAGQQDTYLNVVGVDAVLDAVRRCWASLWTDRAVSYRDTNEIDQSTVHLAVVVQRMIDADVAGVMFTANPVTGTRTEFVIDASPGLGEAVVSGSVNPDHFVVAADGRVLDRTIGDKHMAIRSKVGGGTEHVELSTEDYCLTDDQLKRLVDLGKRAQDHYGAPQDTEWALDSEGELWLTQSRPITTLYPIPESTRDGLRAYFSANVAQGVFGPFTPAGLAGMRLVAGAGAKRFGVPIEDPLDGPPVFTQSGGRIYIDITTPLRNPVGRAFIPRLFGMMESRSAEIFQQLTEDPRFALTTGKRGPTLRKLIKGVVRIGAPPRALHALLRPDAVRANAFRYAEEIDKLTRTLPGLTAEQRLDFITQIFTDITIPRVVRVMPVVLGTFALISAMPKLIGDPDCVDDVRVVLKGMPHNVTTEMDLELWRIAKHGSDGDLDRFLAKYGHRAVAEIDLGVPRWSEDPAHVRGVIANYRRVDDPEWAADKQFEKGVAEAEAMVEELAGRAGWRGRLVRAALRRVRALAGVRELPKFCIVLAFSRAREQLKLVGAELAASGVIERADDVFFLDFHEAREALRGKDFTELVAARRADYDRERRRRHVPRMLLSDGTEPEAIGVAVDGALRGTGASPGTVTGVARVVLDPVGAELHPGEILVAPSTDPGWTPLFLTAGGLVMEMGGPNSHGAVVAREYGIPAVVGVARATQEIVTGQTITVHGSSGSVEVA